MKRKILPFKKKTREINSKLNGKIHLWKTREIEL